MELPPTAPPPHPPPPPDTNVGPGVLLARLWRGGGGRGGECTQTEAKGKGHRRPPWISMTQSRPGRWQEGADGSPLPAKRPSGAGGESRLEKGTRLGPGGHGVLPGLL